MGVGVQVAVLGPRQRHDEVAGREAPGDGHPYNPARVVDGYGVRSAASRRLAAGRPLSAGLRDSGVFPRMLVQLVSVGEESGSLDEMPGKCAEIHEAHVEDAVDNLATLIEPALTAVLGVVVGGLIVAMYLPVFELGSVFSG